ncbi:MAG: hypothetical protein ACLP56_24395 [Candidatus Sulfotelmatobacter sp.]
MITFMTQHFDVVVGTWALILLITLLWFAAEAYKLWPLSRNGDGKDSK